MVRWIIMATLLLVMGAAVPARAAGGEDCSNVNVVSTQPTKVAACRQLAEQGDVAAQFYVGVMYLVGMGVPQSYEMAFRWLRKPADHGSVQAQYLLGSLYYEARGVRRDYVQAYVWASLAAAQGYHPADSLRDGALHSLSSAEIEQAKTLVAAWKPATDQ
jgi:TPR repeat protein